MKQAWFLLCVSVALLTLARGADAQTKVILGQASTERVPLDRIDHSIWDGLLKRHCDSQGLIDYAAWHKSPDESAALDAYLAALSQGDPDATTSVEAKLAFWINAYNAVTVAGILREYPTASVRRHTSRGSGYNIWRDLLLIAGDKTYSLDAIENQMLRPLGEKRIHFALVSGSRGCPRLRGEAYLPAAVEEQLADGTCKFFALPRNLRCDGEHRTIYVSKILHWFDDEFGATPQDSLAALAPYFPDAETRQLAESREFSVEFVEYDWSLNDQAPPHTARR